MDQQRIEEAESFVPIPLRASISAGQAGTERRRHPFGPCVILSCDVSGFSSWFNTFLAKGDRGVDDLHKALDGHFRAAITQITAQGGTPMFFFGDALLSVWDEATFGAQGAAQRAAQAGLQLAEAARTGSALLPLNLHLASGTFDLLDLGGHNDQWHLAATGSAMGALERIGGLRAPNSVIATEQVIATCGPDVSVESRQDWPDASILTSVPAHPPAPQSAPAAPVSALPVFVSRSPKAVRRWLTSVGLKWVAEERPVTALVTRLHGFDQAAPDAAERLQALVHRVQDCVHTHDGTIDNVMIDDKGAAILSVFGAPPDAHSDDPARGTLSAIEVQASLTAADQAATSAVCTGRAFCALMGNRHLRTYMIVGDAVTRASRISAAMTPGEPVLVDRATQRATHGIIGYSGRSRHLSLKGIGAQTEVWAVPPRRDWTVQSRGVAGRELEFGRLRSLWQQVRSQDAQASVTLIGEAGSGKTTLAMMLRDQAVAQGGSFIIAESIATHREVPYAGLRRVTMEALGITAAMSLDSRQRLIMDALPPEQRALAPLLETVLRCGLEETEATQKLTGQVRAKALEDLLLDVVRRAFDKAGVVLCFEDAQWLDASTCGLLEKLASKTRGLMILALVQSGEGLADAAAPVLPNWEEIILGPLDHAGIEALIRSGLDCTSVAPDLLDRIAQVSRRHPFFAIEVLRGLADAEAIDIADGHATLNEEKAREVPLPVSIDGAVLRRLDQLPPESQVTLRSASVAGQTFSLDLAVDIHPMRIKRGIAEGHLTDHVQRGFLDPFMIVEDQGYSFRHAIVQQVAYRQVPQATRRALHARVATWLEALGERPVIWGLPELAHHWAEAGETKRAVACLGQEAARVFGQGFANNAVALCAEAIRYSGLEMPRDEAAIKAAIGEAMLEIEQRIGTQRPLDLQLDPGEPQGPVAHQIDALIAIAPFAFQANQFPIYAWAAAQAIRLLLAEGHSNAHAFSIFSVVVAAWTGQRALGAAWSHAALELDAETGGHGLGPVGFIDTWFHGHWRDPLTDSAETNRRGAASSRAMGDLQYASYNIAGEVVMVAAAGAPLDEVIALGRRALQEPLVRNSQMQVHLEVQSARALQGATDGPGSLSSDAVREEDAIAWVLGTEFANQIGYYRAAQVRLRRHLGDWEGALEAAALAQEMGQAIAGQTAEIDMVYYGVLARLALMHGGDRRHLDQARTDLETLRTWAGIQPDNFARKAEIVAAILEGVTEDARSAPGRLVHLGETGSNPQDCALAFEYAALLSRDPMHIDRAVDAYRRWGATAVAERLAEMHLA